MRSLRFTALGLLLAVLCLSASRVQAQDAGLTLSLIRAVRISDDTLSFSFKTSQEATGKLIYTQMNGTEVTLTDSVPQTDHLFTIDELDAKHGYTFKLSANQGSSHSNVHSILLSAESVGSPGQSIMPAMQILSPSGNLLDTTLAASSSSPSTDPVLPWWGFLLLALAAFGGWIAYKRYTVAVHRP